jgi:hypothetical protein
LRLFFFLALQILVVLSGLLGRAAKSGRFRQKSESPTMPHFSFSRRPHCFAVREDFEAVFLSM